MEKLVKTSNGQWKLVKHSDLSKLFEILEKMFKHPKTGVMMAEPSDTPGTPHPEDPSKVVHHTADGTPGFAPHPKEQERRDLEIHKLYNNFVRTNKDMSPAGKQLFTKLTQHVLNDPDRHAERTTADSANGGIRLRHLYHLLSNNPDYSIKEHDGGLLLSGVRHLNNVPKHQRPVHQWHITNDGVQFLRPK